MPIRFRRGARPPKEPWHDPGFPRPQGIHYLDYLTQLHAALQPEWYLEVGSQTGASLARASCRVIGVDPQFRISADIHSKPPEVHLFRMTSDDFFAGGFLGRNGIAVDLAFLDGMHLFEFLLRDFMNTEKAAAKGAVVAMHDCAPLNALMAERDWDKTRTRQWTGDVWKLMPILRQYRPDLTVQLMDCAPTGLLVVSGLDPANRALDAAYDRILAEMTPLTLADYGLDQFAAHFPLVPAAVGG